MRKEFRIYNVKTIIFLFTVLFILNGCKKDPVAPTLTTTDVSEITFSTAITGGNITSDGGAEVTARGVCWAATSQPTVAGPHTTDNKGNGSFSSSLEGLTPGTTYYVRAYAVNEAGTAYGNEITFETLELSVPVLTTLEVTAITSNSAVSGGNITSNGGSDITARGVCWASTENPTINDNKTSDGTATGNFASDLTGLQPGATYYVRAYATNSVGTAYGNELTFTTLALRPTLTTNTISAIERTSAVSGGNISSSGGAPVTARGVCWSQSSGPVVTGSHTSDGSGTGSFTSSISGLSPNTFYYVRAYATNSAGTAYGNELTFTTDPVSVPTLTTNEISDVTLTTCLAGGNITSDNGAPVTDRGVCWNATGNPTTAGPSSSSGTGTGSFSVTINGLTAGTVYYVRAYATNSAGTTYGNQLMFSTSISDRDGNIYKTVLIGNQLWMQSDLKTTRYNDNMTIPNIPDNGEWSAATSPGYCWYLNDDSYGETYGILYNWYTVETGKLCPLGWHVPSDDEFKIMEEYLGIPEAQLDGWGYRGTDEGTQIKSTSGWLNSGNGTNSSGFTGLPGGYRYGADGSFYSIGLLTYWWTSTLEDPNTAWYRRLNGDDTRIYRASTLLKGGKFIRCVKN